MDELKVGDVAPDFELPVTMKETWKLSDNIGKDNIVLLFFPLAFSSTCHDEMCSIRDGFNEFRNLNARIVAASIDSPLVLGKWKEELHLPYPLLSDFNKTACTAYGAIHEEFGPLKGVAKRSVFIIDRGGKIRYTWISDDPGNLPEISEIKDVLDELK